MTFDEFKASLSNEAPPDNVSAPLRALWMEAGDDWEGAHVLLQDQPDGNGIGVGACLSAPRRRRYPERRALVSPRAKARE